MTVANDWQPSCSLTTLRVRAAMLRAVREFFIQRAYLEVETPCLSRDIVIDACLEPMELLHSGERWFLQTSPEAHMKRLLAAGTGSIFQISRVFRSGEKNCTRTNESIRHRRNLFENNRRGSSSCAYLDLSRTCDCNRRQKRFPSKCRKN